MDLSDPQVWKDGISVVVGAPHVVVPLLIAAAGAGWWLKSAIAKGAKDAITERLQLARERETDAKEKQTELEKQVEELRAKTAAGASQKELAAITEKVEAALGEFKTANNAVHHVLTAEGILVGRPVFGRPTVQVFEPVAPPEDNKPTTIQKST